VRASVILCFLFVLLFPARTTQARTWHIKPDGTGDAPTIQAGIDSATVGDNVILECGTYHEFSIQMKSGIHLSSSTGLPECVTINGDVQGTVIVLDHVDNSTTIAGLTITRGQPPWYPYFGSAGGGMYIVASSPTLVNCRFLENYADHGDAWPGADMGGGLCCDYSAPTLVNCAFIRNSTRGFGGGMFCDDSSPTLTNCTFSENSAWSGGGLVCQHSYYPSSITLTDCVFSRNSANWGGALSSNYSQVSLMHCTLAENSASFMGSGIYSEGDTDAPIAIANTIVAFGQYGGRAVVESGYPGYITLTCCDLYGNGGGDWAGSIANQAGKSGNFSADPLFCGLNADNYTLKQCSPCAPGNNPQVYDCGLIGALPVGCIGTSITPTTWGHIKAMFR
jgi:hypothetical protein